MNDGLSCAVGGILGLLEGQHADVARIESNTKIIERKLEEAAIILSRVLTHQEVVGRLGGGAWSGWVSESSSELSEGESVTASPGSTVQTVQDEVPVLRASRTFKPVVLTRTPSTANFKRQISTPHSTTPAIADACPSPSPSPEPPHLPISSQVTHTNTPTPPEEYITFAEEFREDPPPPPTQGPAHDDRDSDLGYAAAEEWSDPDFFYGGADTPPPPPPAGYPEMVDVGVMTDPAGVQQFPAMHPPIMRQGSFVISPEDTTPSMPVPLRILPGLGDSDASTSHPFILSNLQEYKLGEQVHATHEATSSPDVPVCRMVSTSGASGSSVTCPPLNLAPPSPSEHGTDREGVSPVPSISGGVGKRRHSTSPSMFAHGASLSRKQATISGTVEVYKTASSPAVVSPTFEENKLRGSLKRSDPGKDSRRYSTFHTEDIMQALKKKVDKAHNEKKLAKIMKLEKKEQAYRSTTSEAENTARVKDLVRANEALLAMVREEYDRMVLQKEYESPLWWADIELQKRDCFDLAKVDEQQSIERGRVSRREASDRTALQKNFKILQSTIQASAYTLSPQLDETHSSGSSPKSGHTFSLSYYYGERALDSEQLVAEALKNKTWKKKMDSRKDPPRAFYVNHATRERVWDLAKKLCEDKQKAFREDPRYTHVYVASCKQCKLHWEGIPNRWRCDTCSAELWQPTSYTNVASRYCAACKADISKTPPMHNVNCRICGRVCCQACTKQTIPMPRLGFSGKTLVPVCNTCVAP